MNRACVLLLSFSFAILLLPWGAAQTPTPVAGCAHQCNPKDPDVNGPDPLTGSSPVKAILYGHFQDILNRAPLNTQLIDDDEPNINGGYLMPVVATNTGVQEADLHFENNWFHMYSSAGFVEIVDGVWRVHQEPGLAEDLLLASDTITLYFYLSAHALPNQNSDIFPGDTVKVGVLPQVAIYARIETGRHPFSQQSTLIADGDTGTGDPAPGVPGGANRVNVITVPGQPDIYEFAVPMKVKLQDKKIPSVWSGSQGFIVSVNPYQIKKDDGNAGPNKDYQVMQADWRVRTGPKTPVRLIFDVANPLVTKAASVSIFNDAMFIRWSFVSPWGSYDIDDRSVGVEVAGPTAPDKSATGLSRPLIIKRSVDHDGHFKPVNSTWKFDYLKANLADGDYTVKLSVLNLQQSYRLTQDLTFKVSGGEPVDLQIIGGGVKDGDGEGGGSSKKNDDGGLIPGFEALAAVAAVGAVLLARGRRRT